MKTEFIENKWGVSVTLTPESPEEVAQLFRFANNVKAEKPSVSMSFSTKPYCSIHMNKVKETVQKNFVIN